MTTQCAVPSDWDYINVLCSQGGHRVAGERKLPRISLSLRIIVLSRPAWHIFSSSAPLLPLGLRLSQTGFSPQAGLGRLWGSQGNKCHCGISLEERNFSPQTSDFPPWFSICSHKPQAWKTLSSLSKYWERVLLSNLQETCYSSGSQPVGHPLRLEGPFHELHIRYPAYQMFMLWVITVAKL